MKKTKIIVPALALIAFSTAASIAGSVAWFTASRQATINAGSYAVVKTNSDLKCEIKAGVGTTVNDGTKTVTFAGKLTDGSFNHTSGKIYAPNAAGKAIEDEVALTAANLESELLRKTLAGNVKVYTAATFEVEFTVNFGVGELDKGLFLNCTGDNSQFTVDGEAKTAKGFRMAFYPHDVPTGSAGSAKVFADLQASASCKYVSGTDNIDGTAYSGDLMDSAYNAALPDANTERATALARPDYIGTFKASETNPVVTLKYTVVAWFEGTDPEIINRNTEAEYQTVASKLTFEAIDLKAAA